jgi:hypothetical protein
MGICSIKVLRVPDDDLENLISNPGAADPYIVARPAVRANYGSPDALRTVGTRADHSLCEVSILAGRPQYGCKREEA